MAEDRETGPHRRRPFLRIGEAGGAAPAPSSIAATKCGADAPVRAGPPVRLFLCSGRSTRGSTAGLRARPTKSRRFESGVIAVGDLFALFGLLPYKFAAVQFAAVHCCRTHCCRTLLPYIHSTPLAGDVILLARRYLRYFQGLSASIMGITRDLELTLRGCYLARSTTYSRHFRSGSRHFRLFVAPVWLAAGDCGSGRPDSGRRHHFI